MSGYAIQDGLLRVADRLGEDKFGAYADSCVGPIAHELLEAASWPDILRIRVDAQEPDRVG